MSKQYYNFYQIFQFLSIILRIIFWMLFLTWWIFQWNLNAVFINWIYEVHFYTYSILSNFHLCNISKFYCLLLGILFLLFRHYKTSLKYLCLNWSFQNFYGTCLEVDFYWLRFLESWIHSNSVKVNLQIWLFHFNY